MSSTVPVVRQISWLALLFQLGIVAALTFLFYSNDPSNAFIFAALAYTLLAMVLRKTIAHSHRKGMRLVLQSKYSDAIPYFEKSYTYFKQHEWVDKFRFITLMSSSKMGYTEMALCNIGFCYSQIGNGEKAHEYFTLTLDSYPENGVARAGLNMLNAMIPGNEKNS